MPCSMQLPPPSRPFRPLDFVVERVVSHAPGTPGGEYRLARSVLPVVLVNSCSLASRWKIIALLVEKDCAHGLP